MNEVVFCRDEPRLTEKGCMTTMQASLLHGLIKLWVHRLSTHLHTQPYRTFPSVLWKTMSTAYWILVSSLQDYYSPAMMGLKTDQEVLGELVKLKVPAVAELMERHGVMWTLVVSRWFICLFIDILPVEVSGDIQFFLMYIHNHYFICGALVIISYWKTGSNLNSLLSCRPCSEYGTVCSTKGQRSSSAWP